MIATQPLTPPHVAHKHRRASMGEEPGILTDIYQEETHIAVWQRDLSPALQSAVRDVLASSPRFQASMSVSPENAFDGLREVLPDTFSTPLCEDIAQLVDMFCCLFELKRAGLRLKALDAAMCPKFHVDKVPSRLVSTYQGAATQWLPHERVDRRKLGAGSLGKTDSQSGLYTSPQDIRQLAAGDVALLKGERWEGNENGGAVHRSPAVSPGEKRLLLTLDFSH